MRIHCPVRLTAVAAVAAMLALWPNLQASAQISKIMNSIAARRTQAISARQPGSAKALSEAAITSQTAEAGLEINEQLPPRALLQDTPELKRLLGTSPAFVYDPHSRPDPMVIPWTRSRIMFRELSSIAAAATAAKRWDAAEGAYKRILAELPGDQYRAQANEGLSQVAVLKAQDMQNAGGGAGPIVAKLPPWIEANTIGIIRDQKQPMVLVGSFVLKVGDLVPQQPIDVTIAKIQGSSVFYKVLDKLFEVKITEGE